MVENLKAQYWPRLLCELALQRSAFMYSLGSSNIAVFELSTYKTGVFQLLLYRFRVFTQVRFGFIFRCNLLCKQFVAVAKLTFSDAKAAEAAQSAYYDPNRPQTAYVPPPYNVSSYLLLEVQVESNSGNSVLCINNIPKQIF